MILAILCKTIQKKECVNSYATNLVRLLFFCSTSVLLLGTTQASAQSDKGTIEDIRSTYPDEWGVPGRVGLSFSSTFNQFFLVKQEKPISGKNKGTTIVTITPYEELVDIMRLDKLRIDDAINVAFDNRRGHLYLLNNRRHQLIQFKIGSNGALNQRSAKTFDISQFGLVRPQGMDVDADGKFLYILESDAPQVVKITLNDNFNPDAAEISEIDLSRFAPGSLRGLAVHPGNGHIFVWRINKVDLYELTQAGELLTTYNTSDVSLVTPRDIVFGQSTDVTDSRRKIHLFIADSKEEESDSEIPKHLRIVNSAIIEVDLNPTGEAKESSAAATSGATKTFLVQTIDTSRFSPPSPDPAGIGFISRMDDLLVSDSEVNEMSIFKNKNLFELNLSGSLTRSGSTTRAGAGFSNEPTGIGYNPNNEHIFVSDDQAKDITEVDPGSDGLYGTSDDKIVSLIETDIFSKPGFDPEGVTYDPNSRDLFIIDGVNNEIYRVDAGSNGRFDGVPAGGGDDVVTSFDTAILGIKDPEGIHYDETSGRLLVVGKITDEMYEVTTSGNLTEVFDISVANARKPAGITMAPGSKNPSRMNFYVVDRGVDNNANPNENDGKIYELTLDSNPNTNTRPSVSIDAPSNGSSFAQGQNIRFEATANDAQDGNIANSLEWSSSINGNFGSGEPVSISTLSPGAHTITATATDSGGLTDSDQITITISTTNAPPVVQITEPNDGSMFNQGQSISFKGTATDPEDANVTSSIAWRSNINGQFGSGGSVTTSSLSAGIHTITATANDSKGVEGSDEIVLTVKTTSGTQMLEVRINAKSDDAEERIDQVMSTSSGDLECGFNTEGTDGNQTIGLRFRGISIPKGAFISNAYVQFHADESGSKSTALTIRGQDSNNPSTFSSSTANISSRPVTSTSVNWSPAAWSAGDAGLAQRTPNLAAILQEIISRSGWSSGNAVALVIKGSSSGKRTAEAFQSSAPATIAPLLHIEFSTTGSGSNTPPTVTINSPSNGATFSEGETISFSGNVTDVEDSNSTLSSNLRWTSNITGGTIGNGGSFNRSNLPVGSHTITASVTDSGGLSGSDSITVIITSSTGGPQTLEVQINAKSDDAEERVDNVVSTGSGDLECVKNTEGTDGDQTVGLRFKGISIPKGATISNAYVQFHADESGSTSTSLTIKGQDSNNASTFSSSISGDISSRPVTSASVNWSPASWSAGDAGLAQRTPNLAAVIQEIVNRSGWSSGNAVALKITGSGKRTAEAFQSSAPATIAPLLHIEYSN